MSDTEFTPLETMTYILSRWWIVVAMAILGGFVGWAFHFFHPPVYEATAVLTITMDFPQRELTQYEQDYAFDAAGAIISSAAVKDQIITKAQADEISISPTQLDQSMASEVRQSDWELHIRDRDPKVAADLANIWAQAASDALNAALEHALQAEQLQNQIDMLEACLPFAPGMTESTVNPRPTQKDCGCFSLADIQTVLQSWTDDLVQDKKLSLGILSIMKFSLTSNAPIPEKPALFDQASLTLAGALIGFVISLWVAGSRRVRHRG